jgi:hypothetical protein
LREEQAKENPGGIPGLFILDKFAIRGCRGTSGKDTRTPAQFLVGAEEEAAAGDEGLGLEEELLDEELLEDEPLEEESLEDELSDVFDSAELSFTRGAPEGER